MKVLYFCNLYPEKLGGVETLLIREFERLSACGDELVLAFAGPPAPEVELGLCNAGARWRLMPGWSDANGVVAPWRYCRPALRALREERPDVAVVHFGNELPAVFVWTMARLFTRPPLRWIWVQDQRIATPGLLARHLSRIRMVGLFFDRIVAVSTSVCDAMVRRHVPSSRVAVIPNAVGSHTPKQTREAVRAFLGLTLEATLAVVVGSLIPRKRVGFLIEVMEEVNRKGGGLTLLVIGDGPERRDLEHRARTAERFGGRVVFLGRRPDVGDFLGAADLFVHAANAEGCAYAILESMAAGLPAVVTRAGAAEEQVVDGQTGYVVDAGDSGGAFVDAVYRLAADAGLRRRLGLAAQQRWRTMHNVNIVARQYADLYKECHAGLLPVQ